jgi:HptB-dependent secretion and biofilm anti anti-sigma factor
MTIRINQSGEAAVVALSGRFTFAFHSSFRDVLTNQVEQIAHGGKIIFDLGAVEFVDSAALGMLLLAREAVLRRAGTIVLRNAKGQVQRMLEVARLNLLFTIEP